MANLRTKAEYRAYRWKCWKENSSEWNDPSQPRPWVKATLALFGFRKLAWRLYDLERGICGARHWAKAAASGKYIRDNHYDPSSIGSLYIPAYGSVTVGIVVHEVPMGIKQS